MSISLIGILFAVGGLLGLVRSQLWSFAVLVTGAIFLAASAVSLGGANITPGHFALAFLLGAILLRRFGFERLVAGITISGAGLFLLLTTIWAVLSAFILPRLFNGMLYVYPLSLTDTLFYVLEPLRPGPSNINQSIYFIGNLLTFLAVSAIMTSEKRMMQGAAIVLAVAIVNVSIAVLDSLTFSLGFPDLLDFMRNADYAQAYDALVNNMKRLTGSYPEASAFAAVGTGFFAFALRLWRGGIYPKISGPVAAATLVAVMLAFSTTGYVAIGLYVTLVYARNLTATDPNLPYNDHTLVRRMTFIALGPVAAFVLGIIIAIRPDILDPVVEIFQGSLVNKMSSDSGIERTAWNMSALGNVFETFGLGAGLGSVRASSFVIGVPANIGIPGVLLFGMFFYKLFFPTRAVAAAAGSQAAQIQAAGRSGCFAFILAASVSSSGIDLGLLFFIMAAMSAAPLLKKSANPGFVHQPEGKPLPPPPSDQVLIRAIEASRKAGPAPRGSL